jgi:hypothetical protein
VRFVTDAAKKRGIAIEPAAARALVQALGDALGPLERELEKVALYVGADHKMDVAAVEECVRPIREDRCLRTRARDRAPRSRPALAITDRLFIADAHAGHGIIGPLTWNVRSLLVLQDCLRTGRTRSTKACACAPPTSPRPRPREETSSRRRAPAQPPRDRLPRHAREESGRARTSSKCW